MIRPAPDNGGSREFPGPLVSRRRLLLTIGGLTVTIAAGFIPDPHPAAGAAAERVAGRAAGQDPAAAAAVRAAIDADFRHATAAIGGAVSAVEEADARTRAAALSQPLTTLNDYPPKSIALTIDDGPSPVYTPQVLQLLQQYRVTATFSMIGTQVAAYPRLASEVAAAGHTIANHTWTHANLPSLATQAIYAQMARASDAIQAATGAAPKLFRAPYGDWSPAVLQQCERMQLVPLDWSVDPRDWSRPGVPSIVSNIMTHTRSGSIILEHDGGGNRSQTVAALRIVLPRLLAEGFRFETP
jgi:peptidoglycan-N-acetylglucosamine deacetylase